MREADTNPHTDPDALTALGSGDLRGCTHGD